MSMFFLVIHKFKGYDGPLQYTMVNDNPDQVISILPVSDSMDGKYFQSYIINIMKCN